MPNTFSSDALSGTNIVGDAGVDPRRASHQWRHARTAELTALGLIGLGVAILPLLADAFTLSVVTRIMFLAVLALSFQIMFGMGNVMSFGHAGFSAIAAYAAGALIVHLGWGHLPAVLLAVALTAAVATLIGFVFIRLELLLLAVATLALGEIVFVLAQQLRGITGGQEGLFVPAVTVTWMAQRTFDYYVTAIIFLAVLVGAVNLYASRPGRILRAAGDDPDAAEARGINVVAVKTTVFAVCSAIAGLAGIVYMQQATVLGPEVFALDLSILILAMVAVGGFGSTWGALVGAVVLGGFPQVFASFLDYRLLIYGIMLVLIFRVAPNGIAGGAARLSALVMKK